MAPGVCVWAYVCPYEGLVSIAIRSFGFCANSFSTYYGILCVCAEAAVSRVDDPRPPTFRAGLLTQGRNLGRFATSFRDFLCA